MSGGGKGAAVAGAGPVPQSLRKLVQSLKEIVNRPDAEIYAALRECGMDPDDAVSRLLSQDTFQEVKSKRDKKKEAKDIPEPRSRAANNATSRGVRGGPDRGGRNSHTSSTDNATSRSSVSGPGMTPTNSTQKQVVPSSAVNKTVVADGSSVPLQPSSGFQHGWSGTPGQLSLADIVKKGKPQAQGKPSTKTMVTQEKGYAGQYPSLPSTANQNFKQSVSAVPPTELDEGLTSTQDSVLVTDHTHPVIDNRQTYDNDWSPQDELLSGKQSSFPGTSGDPSLYDAPLHSSVLVTDVGYSDEKSYLDENSQPAITSVNSSEKNSDHYGGSFEYNDGLLQNSTTYQAPKHSHMEEEVEESNVGVSSSANFQGLGLQDEGLDPSKFAEDNPAVIIPDHLQVANTGCAGLSFGSFESGAFSGLLPSKSTDNNVELPAVEESEPVDQIDMRDQGYYDNAAVNLPVNENIESIMGSNTENIDVSSIPQTNVLRQEILDDTLGIQYNQPSVSSHEYLHPTQPNAMDAIQGNNQAHTLSHLSSLLQANTLQNNLLGSNMAPLRDLDFNLSPLLAAQSMGTRYSTAAPSTTEQAISMQEPMKPGVFSNTQSTQNLPSTNIQTALPLPQQLAVHPYSQPSLPMTPFAANMIGYPYLAQNYSAYLPSAAFQQTYSSNGPFHQSAAAVPGADMKYSIPQYKSNISAANLQQQQQQQPSSVISSYGGFGSLSNLPTNFNLNQNATSGPANLTLETLSQQIKDAKQYMALQQGDNSAMWPHGAGSRGGSTVPPNHFYGYQGQSQHGAFHQPQQPQQPSHFGGNGYPTFYHSQSSLLQEHQPQNPAEGGLNGFQAAQLSQQSHLSWQQQHTNY